MVPHPHHAHETHHAHPVRTAKKEKWQRTLLQIKQQRRARVRTASHVSAPLGGSPRKARIFLIPRTNHEHERGEEGGVRVGRFIGKRLGNSTSLPKQKCVQPDKTTTTKTSFAQKYLNGQINFLIFCAEVLNGQTSFLIIFCTEIFFKNGQTSFLSAEECSANSVDAHIRTRQMHHHLRRAVVLRITANL